MSSKVYSKQLIIPNVNGTTPLIFTNMGSGSTPPSISGAINNVIVDANGNTSIRVPFAYVVASITTPKSTGANMTPTTLNTVAVPGAALITNGDKIKISAFFETNSNTHSKVFGIDIGGISILTVTTTTSSEAVLFELEIVKESDTAYAYNSKITLQSTGVVTIGNANNISVGVGSFSAGFNIDAVGTNGNATAGDITNNNLLVDLIRLIA